jgi:hypothetical protein
LSSVLASVMRVWVLVVVIAPAMAWGAGTATAAPTELSAGEGEIDDALCADHLRADKWDEVWAITFAVTAAGSAGYATFAPDGWIWTEHRAALYVTAAKATVGVIGRLVHPLYIDVQGLCLDPHPASSRARHALLFLAAQRERDSLLLNILGGLAINTVGLLYLGYGRGDWESAWTSFGIGTGVGVASAVTAPAQSWLLGRRLDRSHHVVAVPMIGGGGSGAALVGTW